MTPDAVGGWPPAIPAGEPTIISQPVNSPATTDRLLFRDIVPSPLCRVRPAIIGMDGDRGPCRPDPQGLPLDSHAQREDRAVDFTIRVQLAERVTLQQTIGRREGNHGV